MAKHYMDMTGKTVMITGASRGIGAEAARVFAEANANVVLLARSQDAIADLAGEIGKTAIAIPCNVARFGEMSSAVETALGAFGSVDVLINNAGGPPPGDFRDWDRDVWIKAIDANMLTAIFLIKDTVDGMIERRFGRIVNITSSAVKAPVEILGLSNGARSGLTEFVAGLARKTVAANVTINNLLPGAFDTDRMNGNIAAAAKKTGADVAEMTKKRAASIPAGRFGDPYEFGEYCAFLCSAQAGYITGQNILMDGGYDPDTATADQKALALSAVGIGDVAPAEATLTISGEALLPLAPVHMRARRDGAGGWAIAWTRRSRDGWRWLSGTDVPMAEESESYAVQVMDGTVLVRAQDRTSPGWTYTADMIAADGMAGRSVTICVRQRGTYALGRAASLPLIL